MLRKNNRSKKGFTLAELLVVIVIIAVLAAIAIPMFSAATTRAQIGVQEANSRAVHAEMMVEQLSNGTTVDSQAFTINDLTYTWYLPAEDTTVDGVTVAAGAPYVHVTGSGVAGEGEGETVFVYTMQLDRS